MEHSLSNFILMIGAFVFCAYLLVYAYKLDKKN